MANKNETELKEIKEDATQKAVEAALHDQKAKHADELKQLNEALDEEKKKTRFKPVPAPVPKEQQGLPEGMHETQIKTTVKNMSTVISNALLQMKDMATVEVLLDTNVRMKKRLNSVKKMGAAENMKIRNTWKTTPPQMYIAQLEGKKISNDEYQISFGVFETDDKGNKKLYTHYADVVMHDGSKIKRATSAEYRIAYEVIETIKTNRPITREVIKIDRIQE